MRFLASFIQLDNRNNKINAFGRYFTICSWYSHKNKIWILPVSFNIVK